MKVDTCGPIDMMSGTHGEMVYVRQPNGNLYIRRRPCRHRREPSEDQKQVRLFTSRASAHWAELTDAQREAWQQYAKTHIRKDGIGRKANPNPISTYVQANMTRQILGLPFCTDAPAEGPPQPPVDLEALETADPATVGVRIFHSYPDVTNLVVLARMAPPPKSDGRKIMPNTFRYICHVNEQSVKPLPPDTGEVFFSPVQFPVGAGKRYAVEIRIARIQDGIPSRPRERHFRRPV